MKRYYFLLNLSVYLLFLSLFVTATMEGKIANFIVVIISGVLILLLPLFAIFIFLKKSLEEKHQKKERIKKYGKYLRAAGLPEDIKDVLGHFLYFEINFDHLRENSYLVSRFLFSNYELKLILHEDKRSEDLFINIRSNDNGKILVELKIDKDLPAVSNLVLNSIKIL